MFEVRKEDKGKGSLSGEIWGGKAWSGFFIWVSAFMEGKFSLRLTKSGSSRQRESSPFVADAVRPLAFFHWSACQVLFYSKISRYF